MNNERIELYYHEMTDTYWANDIKWKERWKNEVVSFGHLNMNTEDIQLVTEYMTDEGFYMVNDVVGTPFEMFAKLDENIKGDMPN